MDNQYRHIVLHFDTAEHPVFKENKAKGFVEFGKDNKYPKYLLDLYNESPKHGAIIKSKCGYITGKGFENPGMANSRGETWNNILRRLVKDDELYRGFYLQVIWNRLGKISDVFHIEFHKVRVNKDLTEFYVKNDWDDSREKVRVYPPFNTDNPVGSQIYYFKEYNPYSEVYPIPAYFQALNYIESDIQVARHILGNAKQGFVGSKLINLNNGMPVSEEQKGEVERGLLKKFTGSEGKRVVIMFNPSKENAAEILDLGNTMLTKEDFTNINNLIQQEIFAGHQVVSPSLMGIKTEGQLGGRNEIRDAYEIFNNVYVTDRQQNIEEIITKFRNLKGEIGTFKIQPVEPLKFEFSEAIMSQNLTQEEIRALMGKEPIDSTATPKASNIADNLNTLSPLVATKVLESMTPDEIRQLAGLQPNPNGLPSGSNISGQGNNVPQIASNEPTGALNSSLANLTGRQYQNIMRIVRHFGSGKITKEQASLMLRTGFGLTDKDIDTFLGVDSNPITDDEIQAFSDEELFFSELGACGEDMNNYKILHSYKVRNHIGFADQPILNQLQANILDIITKQKDINPEGIAKAVKTSVKEVNKVLNWMNEQKIINISTQKVGSDLITKYEVLQPNTELPGKVAKTQEIFVRYTYEGPEDSRNRPFCYRLVRMSANKSRTTGKTWSMVDIQNMSERMGYSVLDRRGGFWNDNGDIKVHCRHDWVANLVTKK